MNISNQFNEQPWSKKLGIRTLNFEMMVNHISAFAENRKNSVIIETGTAWDKNNWDGQGQSTLIWDWVSEIKPSIDVFSLEIMEAHVKTASSQTKNVIYKLGNSIETLNKFDKDTLGNVGLLYLDSYDWTTELNLESSFHHMCELAAVWSHLPKGCLIVVDDRHGDMAGKHWLVEAFMENFKAEIVFKNCQMGWIKP